MQDFTSEANSPNIDGMLGAFFGNVSQRAFGRLGSNIQGLDSKFKRLSNVAQSSFEVLRTSANKAGDAVDSLNRKLREQTDRIRNMPRFRQPTGGTPHPTTGQPRDPSTGRWLPGRGGGGRGGGWGWGDGGGTRFGSRFSPGGGLGGISAFGGLGSIGVLFGGASAARGFGRFDANLATLQAEAGLDADQRKDVTGRILDIAGSTQFDTQQVSSTLIAMVKDGIELNEALNQVPNVLRLAVAESTDLESAWSAMRGFVQSTNSSWEDSVRLSDMMSNATSLSAAKLRDLQDVASRGLTAHSSLEAFSTEGFLAITGILKSLNISNEVIGTGMRQFGTTIARATEGGLTDNAMAALQARGIQFERGMTEVEALKEIQAGVEGMADTELKNFFHEVFGERAKKVFENIIPKVDELAEKMELIRKKGTVNEKFEIHAKSLTNQMKLLTSAGDSLIKKFVMILNEGESFGDGIGWVTAKITQFTAFMEANKDTIQAWWGNFKEVLGGLFNFVASGVEKVAAFWAGLSEGEKTIGALAAVIGAFVLGPVTGLIAAGALIIAKWDEIRGFFSGLFDKLDEPVTGFITSVRDKTMNVVNWIQEQWDEMSPYFKKIWSGISFVADNTWKLIRFTAESAWEFIKIIWQPVSAFFRVLWEGIKLIVTVAWEGIKGIIKGAVITIEGLWNGLKAVFNWSPIKFVREQFSKLIGFFRDLIVKLKKPFEDFMGFVTGIFNKIADGIEKIRGWFRRGKDDKEQLVLTVDTETAQKEIKTAVGKAGTLKLKVDANAPKFKGISEDMQNLTPEQFFQKQKVDTFYQETFTPAVSQLISNMATVVAAKQVKQPTSEKVDYYETKAVKSPSVSGPPKPQAGLEAFVAAEKEARKAEAQRRADAGLGKLEKRTMRTAPKREFVSEVNREYTSKEALYEMRADKATLAQKADDARRQGILAEAHTFEGRIAPSVDRYKVLNRLQTELPKLFEKFYDEDKEKTPVIPEVVLSGDDKAFAEWTEKLTGRMQRQEARLKEPTTRTALGGFDKGGITADKLMNRERDRKKALEELEATRVIRFPKLDDEQYRDMSQMFRSGFLSLVDVNSAILAEMQTQTQLLGSKVDTTSPVIRPQGDAVFDDEIANRVRGIQEMSGIPMKDTPKPEARQVSAIKVVQSTSPAPAIEKVSESPSPPVVLNKAPDTESRTIQPTPQSLPILKETSQSGPIIVSDTQKPEALPPTPSAAPQTTAGLGNEINLEKPSAPKTGNVVSPTEVSINKQPAILKDIGLPEFELSAPSSQVEVASPEISATPIEIPIARPEIQDALAPHAPVIEPEMATALDVLLEELKGSDSREREGERVTPTGQRVEVGREKRDGTTIENINITINADASQSPREIAKSVMEEFERMRRERNF